MKLVQAFLLSVVLGFASLTAVAAPVDINTADAKALDQAMKGVGPKTAAAIVDYRAKNGPFKSVDDLKKVKGVGPAIVDKNRANLTAGGATPVAAKATSVPQKPAMDKAAQ